MKTFNGLPLYEDTIYDESCGMLRISLVDLPAVDSDFQKFGKAVKVVMASEEQRLILGVVMRANYPIYRVDEERGEYYTIFSAETIRTMAEKYLAENRQNRVNLMHCGEEMRGVYMNQMFIKDTAKGVAPAGFEEIEDGSLFMEFHVEDDEIWNWIKEGILRGFSLEGFFGLEETYSDKNMAIDFKKMKRSLAKILAKFTETSTDKGVLTYEGDLEVGKDVYLLNADGEIVDAADGEYLAEDGRVIVVEGGKVADIREKAEEPKEAEPVEAEDEENPEQVADDVDIHNLAEEVERLKADRDDLKQRVEKLEELLGSTTEALQKMAKMSVGKPAHQEVKANEATERKFRNAHEQMLYELNKAR